MESWNQNSGVPKLKGKENYAAWRLVIDVIIRKEKLSHTTSKRKKGGMNIELDARIQQLIVTSVTKRILMNLAECRTLEEMLHRLDKSYGTHKDDLGNLYKEFHNFRYRENESMQENGNWLESLKMQLESLDETVSESSVRVCLLQSLPRQFCSIVSAYNINKEITWDQLVKALVTEDHDLNNIYEKHGQKKESRSETGTVLNQSVGS